MWLPETAIRMEIDQLNRQQRLLVMTMNRAEALRIGTAIANCWWKYYKPIILSQQHIDKQKHGNNKK